MLIALDKNNQRVCASDAEKGDEFYCPYCSSPMLVKKGAIKVPHFAHISATTTCEYDRESKEHMLTKLSIYDWLAEQRVDEVDMEYPLEECRPDIFFVHQGKKVAVEIQLSPIPAAEIILRTQLMNRQGIHVLWLIQSLPINSEFRARDMWRVLSSHTGTLTKSQKNIVPAVILDAEEICGPVNALLYDLAVKSDPERSADIGLEAFVSSRQLLDDINEFWEL